jgi:hypothetical protein
MPVPNTNIPVGKLPLEPWKLAALVCHEMGTKEFVRMLKEMREYYMSVPPDIREEVIVDLMVTDKWSFEGDDSTDVLDDEEEYIDDQQRWDTTGQVSDEDYESEKFI